MLRSDLILNIVPCVLQARIVLTSDDAIFQWNLPLKTLSYKIRQRIVVELQGINGTNGIDIGKIKYN
jgi:hypothetical protein